jgi:chromosome segregation ATPase
LLKQKKEELAAVNEDLGRKDSSDRPIDSRD